MHDFKPEQVLSAGYLMSQAPPPDFQDCLALLEVDNCILTLVGKDMPQDAAAIASTHCTEPWYNIPYSVGTVPHASGGSGGGAEQWRAILDGKAGLSVKAQELAPLPIRLAEPNPFLPSNFELVSAADDGEVEDAKDIAAAVSAAKSAGGGLPGCLAAPGVYKRPLLLATSSKGQLWHKRDTTFEQPKTELTLKIVSPSIMSNPVSTALSCWYLVRSSDLDGAPPPPHPPPYTPTHTHTNTATAFKYRVGFYLI